MGSFLFAFKPRESQAVCQRALNCLFLLRFQLIQPQLYKTNVTVNNNPSVLCRDWNRALVHINKNVSEHILLLKEFRLEQGNSKNSFF